jgi:hypothetical protein
MANTEADSHILIIVEYMDMNVTTTFISFLVLTTVCLLIVDVKIIVARDHTQ